MTCEKVGGIKLLLTCMTFPSTVDEAGEDKASFNDLFMLSCLVVAGKVGASL